MKFIKPLLSFFIAITISSSMVHAQNVRHLKLTNTADFSISKINSCSGDSITFTYTGNAPASANFSWDIAGIPKTGQGPFTLPFSITGQKQASLVVEYNNSTDSLSKDFFIHELPAVSFFPDPQNSVTGDTIHFINQSTPSNATFAWDFGNGSQSSDISPAYAFTSPGTFEVSLTATSLYGCTQTLYNIPVNISAAMEVPLIEKPLACNVYPNPSTGQFTISLPETTAGKIEIRVLNIYGQLVYQASEKNISEIKLNLQGSQPGTYLLMIRDDERIAHKKIQVE